MLNTMELVSTLDSIGISELACDMVEQQLARKRRSLWHATRFEMRCAIASSILPHRFLHLRQWEEAPHEIVC